MSEVHEAAAEAPDEIKDSQPEQHEGNGKEPEKRKRKRKRKRKNKTSQDEEEGSDDGDEVSVENIPEKERTLFMEGLPYDCTQEEVRAFLLEHKCCNILELKLPTWNDTGRLRGYGHVVFKSKKSTQQCLQDVDGKSLKGRYIKLAEAKGRHEDNEAARKPARTQPPGCCAIFIKNLPYEITEEELAHVFSHCGKLIPMPQGVRLARDSVTQKPKGFGYVDFKNPEGAATAVNKASKGNGIVIRGRRVLVDYEEGKAKGSFKTRDGRIWNKEFKDPKANSRLKRPKL